MTPGDGLLVRGDLIIPERDLSIRATRASGPGGQNVNRVSTKVELRFDLPGTTALDPGCKARLRRLAESRLDADGFVVIVSQVTRSQSQNIEQAKAKLVELIRAALIVPKRRKKTRPTRASTERRLDDKRRQSQKKQGRGRSDD
ncbi:MAG: aminoacyl-tRNA hydrolase [Polyangiaceae bacterium]|nr:aminoacyl-tRNA hydrolase [Polyangiaceae bacterium]